MGVSVKKHKKNLNSIILLGGVLHNMLFIPFFQLNNISF